MNGWCVLILSLISLVLLREIFLNVFSLTKRPLREYVFIFWLLVS